ncbi:MAG TPA: AAA family ATPase, partial [Pyrinomonadaceae bacterium]|nr:AAA family ATPase [Pyrinomonadaceae bacterium]
NPARDRYKVFIIDEVHQLSKAAFNALLKTLEEPPENVVFVMATTELHKVPDTILSRCQEFEFRTIPLQKIFDRLKLIADAEKIDITNDALRELSRSGEGSMRDAQSNFDQVISFSADKIESQDVTNALGFAGVEVLSKTIDAIASRDIRAILGLVDDLISRGHDLRNFCRDLLALFRDLLVSKVAGDEKGLFDAAVFSGEDAQRMAGAFTEADLIRFFNSLAETEASLRDASHPRYMLEIGLVKLLEMRSVADLESILQRLESLGFAATLPARMSAASGQTAPPVLAATKEKKTLISEPVAPPREIHTVGKPPPPPFVPEPKERSKDREDVFEGHVEEMLGETSSFDEPDDLFGPPDSGPSVEIVEKRPETAWQSRETSPIAPVRLARLSSEELAHFDDTKLDDAYEEKLYFTGDDRMPIRSAASIAATFAPAEPVRSSNGSSGTAAAPAMDVSHMIADLDLEDEAVDLPELSDDPTEDELLAYAKAHPAVRRAIRVFRGKITKVERS